MDSITKSIIVGRISGPISWAISICLAKYFDISISEEEQKTLTKIVAEALVYLFAAYGTITPIISKIREKKCAK